MRICSLWRKFVEMAAASEKPERARRERLPPRRNKSLYDPSYIVGVGTFLQGIIARFKSESGGFHRQEPSEEQHPIPRLLRSLSLPALRRGRGAAQGSDSEPGAQLSPRILCPPIVRLHGIHRRLSHPPALKSGRRASHAPAVRLLRPVCRSSEGMEGASRAVIIARSVVRAAVEDLTE